MTFQWTIVAGFLYLEILLSLLLLLPWIRPSAWCKLFCNRLVSRIAGTFGVYFYTGLVGLMILFADATRGYHEHSIELGRSMENTANADALMHLKLFRAQRNFYISGGAILMFLINRRLISLLQRAASLENAAEAGERLTQTSRQQKGIQSTTKSNENEEIGKQLKQVHDERDNLKEQMENLQKEYKEKSEMLKKRTKERQ